MLRRLFGLVVVLALVGAGLYYWKGQELGLHPPRSFGDVGRQVEDVALAGVVKGALELNRNLKSHPIEVSSEDSIVTLRGRVPDEPTRTLAERVAGSVPRVKQVVNLLKIDPNLPASTPDPQGRSVGERLDDETLEVKVKLAFSLHKELQGSSIEVSVFRRQVTLRGELSSRSQRALALETARAVEGVTSVVDALSVQGEAVGGTLDAVRKALAENANLSSRGLQVHEEKGSLVLTGQVSSGAEKDLAGLLARQAAGREVENRVEVR